MPTPNNSIQICSSLVNLEDIHDARLDPFRNLPERTLRGESLFIAEGELVGSRLLRSAYSVESVLIARDNPQAMALLPEVPKNVPVFTLPEKVMLSEIVGFPYYHGILVLGRRPEFMDFRDLFGLSSVGQGVLTSSPVPSLEKKGTWHSRMGAWVVLPDATKPDNLGLVFRAAAALGARGVVLGEQCCDPFSRRALRVSMGGVLQVPICVSRHLAADLRELRASWEAKMGKEERPALFATVLADDSEATTNRTGYPGCSLFLFGNEYTGLTDEMIELCDVKLKIPMRANVDSLNLGVSAGIFLYEYMRLTGGRYFFDGSWFGDVESPDIIGKRSGMEME